MNISECENLLKSVKWADPTSLISLFLLEIINVLVIVGNCLVITAVFCSNKLRSVTNFLIVNLAVADLLVGVAVLPFSATWEVYKVWIFGGIWCRIWLALDVWTCTASILTLCAISLDRYVAVTRPVNYLNIMSTERAKLLICGVWVLSFVICFPPLLTWQTQEVFFNLKVGSKNTTNRTKVINSNVVSYAITNSFISTTVPLEEEEEETLLTVQNNLTFLSDDYEFLQATTIVDEDNEQQTPIQCPWKCELTNDRGYVLYSALGSFYIPMFVMLFFYWRIYRAAIRTTKAINQGFKTEKWGDAKGSNGMEESRLILRIHRGRACNTLSTSHRTPLSSTQSVNSNTEESVSLQHMPSYSSIPKRATSMRLGRQRQEKVMIKISFPSTENMLKLNSTENTIAKSPTEPACSTQHMVYNVHHGSVKSNLFEVGEDTAICHRGSLDDLQDNKKRQQGKRHIKFQVKRFRMETKAAKTLAIIVGGFIVCWLPFFTMYLIRGFCEECIQPQVFSVLFWLGYCNSAINPLVYALFSNDFRLAFNRIICRCVCSRSAFRASENFHAIAARAFMAPAAFHNTISGCSDEFGGKFS